MLVSKNLVKVVSVAVASMSLMGISASVSVGGNRVRVRTHVIGFTIPSSEDPTEEYYCFAGQQLGEDKYGETKPAIQIIARFDTMHEAAEAGFSPHFYFLNEPIFKEDKNTVTILH